MTNSITWLDVKRAVVERIKENFTEQVINQDVTEDFPEKSFFVAISSVLREAVTNTTDDVTYHVEIQYLKDTHNRLVEQAEKLCYVFSRSLPIAKRVAFISQVQANIEDYNLYVEFDIVLRTDGRIAQKEQENMNEIKITY